MVLVKAGGQLRVEQDIKLARIRQYFSVMRNLKLGIFIELNRNKLKFLFLFTSVVFLGLLALLLIIAYYNGSFPGRSLLINILLSTGLGFPTFIIIILYIEWLRRHQAKMYIFSKAPFDKLDSIGFHKAYSNLETKWDLTEEIRAGRINDISLTCDLSEKKSRVLEFKAQSTWKQLDKKEFQRISKKFEKQDVDICIGAFIKNIPIRKTHNDIYDLRQELEQFTELLKSEGFRSP